MSFAHYLKLGRRDLLDLLFSLRFFPSPQLISYTRCFYRYLHLYALAQPHRYTQAGLFLAYPVHLHESVFPSMLTFQMYRTFLPI